MTLLASPGTVPLGQKVSAVWTRVDEDVATISLHFVKLVDGECVPFDGGAFDRVEGNIADVWSAIKGHYDPSISLDRFEWHEFGVGVRKPNPRSRETIIAGGAVGTADADTQLPPQIACSVTFKTSRRHEWGRIYMPAPVTDRCVAGRILAGFCDDLRTAWGTLLDDQASHDSPLVVWAPRHGGVALKYGKLPDGTTAHEAGLDNPDSTSFALTVDLVQVDDLFDVVRRRRYDTATHKATHSLGA